MSVFMAQYRLVLDQLTEDQVLTVLKKVKQENWATFDMIEVMCLLKEAFMLVDVSILFTSVQSQATKELIGTID